MLWCPDKLKKTTGWFPWLINVTLCQLEHMRSKDRLLTMVDNTIPRKLTFESKILIIAPKTFNNYVNYNVFSPVSNVAMVDIRIDRWIWSRTLQFAWPSVAFRNRTYGRWLWRLKKPHGGGSGAWWCTLHQPVSSRLFCRWPAKYSKSICRQFAVFKSTEFIPNSTRKYPLPCFN